MLTDTSQTAIDLIKRLGELIPADAGVLDKSAKIEAALVAGNLALVLQKISVNTGNEPMDEEFYLEFAKATPPHFRELMLAHGLHAFVSLLT